MLQKNCLTIVDEVEGQYSQYQRRHLVRARPTYPSRLRTRDCHRLQGKVKDRAGFMISGSIVNGERMRHPTYSQYQHQASSCGAFLFFRAMAASVVSNAWMLLVLMVVENSKVWFVWKMSQVNSTCAKDPGNTLLRAVMLTNLANWGSQIWPLVEQGNLTNVQCDSACMLFEQQQHAQLCNLIPDNIPNFAREGSKSVFVQTQYGQTSVRIMVSGKPPWGESASSHCHWRELGCGEAMC